MFALGILLFIVRIFVSRAIVGAVAGRLGLGLFARGFATLALSHSLRQLFSSVRQNKNAFRITVDVLDVMTSVAPLGFRSTVKVIGTKAMLRTFAHYREAVVGNTMLTDINRLLVFKTLTGVVTRTPVDTGTARASWHAERADGGQPKGSNVKTFRGGGGAAAQRALASAGTINYGPDGIYWVTNNQPYIEALEFGLYTGSGPKTIGGFSTQAPQGMVRITLAEIAAELDNDMRKIVRIEEAKVQRTARRV